MSTPKKAKYTAPHGTLDIMGSEYYQRQGFFEKGQEVAMYYGFEPVDTPILEHEDFLLEILPEGYEINSEMAKLKTISREKYVIRPEITSSIIRLYAEHDFEENPQPLLLYSFGPVFRAGKVYKNHLRQFHQFNLEVVGTEKPIATAMTIATAYRILQECGAPNLFIDINTLGNKQSLNDYKKALRSYYKKHLSSMNTKEKELASSNPLLLMDSKNPSLQEINENAPDIFSYLATQSKNTFKTTLEYLDEIGIPYRINKRIVRGLPYYKEVVFEIVNESFEEDSGESQKTTLAGGGMYEVAIGKGKNARTLFGTGLAIGAERVLSSPWWKKLTPRIIKETKIYFIQAGFKAKLHSIPVIEELKKAKIPVYQSLSTDSISKQLEFAEKTDAKIAIILGQKEVIDETIIVRDMATRAQETIPQKDLVKYLKKNFKV